MKPFVTDIHMLGGYVRRRYAWVDRKIKRTDRLMLFQS